MNPYFLKFWKNKRVLITGHTGFKGSWLVCSLLKFNTKIIGYSQKPEKNSLFTKAKLQNKIFKNFYKDINSLIELDKVIKKERPEIIFHLAAQPLVQYAYQNPVQTFKDNCIGTLNVMEVIKRYSFIKSAVIITTDKVYKNENKIVKFKEDDFLWGKDPYSASKVCAEQVVSSYKCSFSNYGGINFTSVARSGNVIGGCDHNLSRIIPDIFLSYKQKKKLFIRMPKAIRPWQHVLEPTLGYMILAQKQFNNLNMSKDFSWNFGPEKHSFKKVEEIVNFYKQKLKIKVQIKKSRLKESTILMLDSKKAKNKLKWKSKWNLEKTLEKIYDVELARKNDFMKIINSQISEFFS